MHRLLSTSQAGTLTILLVIVLIVCNILADGKTSGRKPPFNGSIFGKRSNLPPMGPGLPVYNNANGQHQSSKRNNRLLSGLLLQQQQQDNSLRALINQCLIQADTSVETDMLELCEDLLTLALGYDEQPNNIEGLTWI